MWFSRKHGVLVMALALFPLPRGRGVGLVPVRHEALEHPRRLKARWRALVASHPLVAEVAGDRAFAEDFAHVRRAWGHARRYGAAGAMLIGDAAHPVSPAGGQGANMSVADAAALADVLVRLPSDALAEYERHRRPANARSMRFTRAAAAVLSLPASLTARLAPLAIHELSRRPQWFDAVLRSAAAAFRE